METPGSASSWLHRLSLRERLEYGLPEDVAMGREAVTCWRQDLGLQDESAFNDFLEIIGLTDGELQRALGAVPEPTTSQDGAFPSAQVVDPKEIQANPFATLSWLRPLERAFLMLACPIVLRALMQLRRKCEATEGPISWQELESFAINDLARGLLPRISRTLVLELNVARLRGQLEGDSPSTRVDSFGQLLSRPDVANALLSEYAVLARGIEEHVCSASAQSELSGAVID